LVGQVSRFGLIARGVEPGLLEQRIVRSLQEDRCELAWRIAAAGAPPQPVDFIVDLSESAAGRRWCEQASHGVWVLGVGEHCCLDLEPALLENFAARERAVPAVLARWTTPAGRAEVLISGKLRARRTWRRHLDSNLSAIAQWHALARKRIERDTLPTGPGIEPRVGAHRASTLRLLTATARNLFDLATDLFKLDMWNIAVYRGGSARDVFDPQFMDKVSWLPPEDGLRFRADPFGFRRDDGTVVVLCEWYDYRVGKGVIARLVDDRPSTAQELPVHAAYPYLFEYEGKRYCAPEQSESGVVQIFALHESSLSLVDPRPVLPNVPLVDGTLFAFEGLYWLLGTRADDDYNVRLFAWHSDSPFGPWKPHACNPVKFDITGARPAGTPFWLDGALIRPAQDCSQTYGGAVVLNRITALTPTRFAEEPVGRIVPDPRGRYHHGVHTVCVSDGLILVDGKYHRRHWLAPLLRWRIDRASARRRKMMASTH
jgi:hypothetical protein